MGNYFSDQEARGHFHGWHIYIVSVSGFTKIGTAATIKYRISDLQHGNPLRLTLEAAFKFSSRTDAMTVEKSVLKRPTVNRIKSRDWCHCHPDVVIGLVRDVCSRLKINFKELDAAEALQ